MTTATVSAIDSQPYGVRAPIRVAKSGITTESPSIRLSADGLIFVGITSALLGSIYAASFFISFEGQRAVAAYMNLTGTPAMALPIAIDLGMVAFTGWGLIRAARKQDTTKPTRLVLASVIASAALNFAHVFVPALHTGITAEVILGSALSTFIPVISYFAAEGLIDLWAKKSKAVASISAAAPTKTTVPTVAPAALAAPATSDDTDSVFGAVGSLARRAGTNTPERIAAVAKTVEVFNSVGSINGASKRLGVDRTTVRNALVDGGIEMEAR